MKFLLLTILLTAAPSNVQWQLLDHGQPVYNPNGVVLHGANINCTVSAVENLMPGQRHHIVCYSGKNLVVDRYLHCDKQQVEDYIEVEDFFLGCKSY